MSPGRKPLFVTGTGADDSPVVWRKRHNSSVFQEGPWFHERFVDWTATIRIMQNHPVRALLGSHWCDYFGYCRTDGVLCLKSPEHCCGSPFAKVFEGPCWLGTVGPQPKMASSGCSGQGKSSDCGPCGRNVRKGRRGPRLRRDSPARSPRAPKQWSGRGRCLLYKAQIWGP